MDITILSAIPSLLWFVFAVIALILLRKPLMQLMDILLWRLRMGSAIKLASFEIGQAIAMDDDFLAGSDRMYSNVRPDQDGRRLRQLETYFVPK